MEVKIRRFENNLITLGTGIIVFGMWSFVKLLLSTLFLEEYNFSKIDPENAVFVNVIVWTLAVLIVLLYVWLGLSARAEGKGKRKRIVYLFFVGIVIFFSTLIIILEIYTLVTQKGDMLTMFLTIIIDVTRLIFMIELMYSSIALRRLKKQLCKKEVSGT